MLGLQQAMKTDAHVDDLDLAGDLLSRPDHADQPQVLDPDHTNRGTAADTTALLNAIWQDKVAKPASCAALRRLLGLQVWPHRLSSGFPAPDIIVSGKTGTLLSMRHEVGAVEYPMAGAMR